MKKKITRAVKGEINRRAFILAQEWYKQRYSECIQLMLDMYERDQLSALEIQSWRPKEMEISNKS